MKDSGCHVVGYGFESFNDLVLKSMKKQITGKEIEKKSSTGSKVQSRGRT
jgi:radical SAM superfamily enzyme YgiQ (UPF0313 family)